MGVEEGFGIYPAVNSGCQDLYDFLEEILQKCKDAVHSVTGKTLIRIVGEPRAEDAYLLLVLRGCDNSVLKPVLPAILVQQSQSQGRCYLREVCFVAKIYFPNNPLVLARGGLLDGTAYYLSKRDRSFQTWSAQPESSI
jgi:hypothetical protein